MHWGSAFMAGAGVNALTLDRCDATSRQPELKHAAVAVERAGLPWRLVAFTLAEAPGRRVALRGFLAGFPFATLTPFGRDRGALLLRAAAPAAPAPELLARLDAALGLAAPGGPAGIVHYCDAGRGVERKLRVAGGQLVAGRLTGDVAAAEWLREWLAEGRSVEGAGRALLAGGSRPPVDFTPRGRVVCNCLGVGEAAIRGAVGGLAPMPLEAALERLQGTLGCGTQCGSCLPEVRRLIAGGAAAARAA